MKTLSITIMAFDEASEEEMNDLRKLLSSEMRSITSKGQGKFGWILGVWKQQGEQHD